MFAKVLMMKDMKLIPLTKGKFAKVDDEDFDLVNKYKWHTSSTGYAYHAKKMDQPIGKKRYKLISMHRLIMGNCDFKHIDHVNHDTTDNRKSNLRGCNAAQNIRNSSTQRFKSAFKGAYRIKGSTRFKGSINYYGTKIYLGTFGTITEAAQAYDVAAESLFGEFAEPTNP